jgi:hypothetical protein
MSDTITDFPKITQMLDNGWRLLIFRNELGSYTAKGQHRHIAVWERAKRRNLEAAIKANDCEGGIDRASLVDLNELDFDTPGQIDTDDFTPEHALTRLAYKVHGELAPTKEPQ